MLQFLFSSEGRKTRLPRKHVAGQRTEASSFQNSWWMLSVTFKRWRAQQKVVSESKHERPTSSLHSRPPVSLCSRISWYLCVWFPTGSSFSFEFLCFSGKCESLASTNFCGNEIYSLITACVKCVSPFDAKTPTHSCICWALLRHHSCRQCVDGAVPEGSRLPQQSFVPPRQLCSLLAHGARAKAALWDSQRFSSGFCQHGRVRSLFISGHCELSCVKVLLQMRQLWFSCRTSLC